jgi:hypothetical protein
MNQFYSQISTISGYLYQLKKQAVYTVVSVKIFNMICKIMAHTWTACGHPLAFQLYLGLFFLRSSCPTMGRGFPFFFILPFFFLQLHSQSITSKHFSHFLSHLFLTNFILSKPKRHRTQFFHIYFYSINTECVFCGRYWIICCRKYKSTGGIFLPLKVIFYNIIEGTELLGLKKNEIW